MPTAGMSASPNTSIQLSSSSFHSSCSHSLTTTMPGGLILLLSEPVGSGSASFLLKEAEFQQLPLQRLLLYKFLSSGIPQNKQHLFPVSVHMINPQLCPAKGNQLGTVRLHSVLRFFQKDRASSSPSLRRASFSSFTRASFTSLYCQSFFQLSFARASFYSLAGAFFSSLFHKGSFQLPFSLHFLSALTLELLSVPFFTRTLFSSFARASFSSLFFRQSFIQLLFSPELLSAPFLVRSSFSSLASASFSSFARTSFISSSLELLSVSFSARVLFSSFNRASFSSFARASFISSLLKLLSVSSFARASFSFLLLLELPSASFFFARASFSSLAQVSFRSLFHQSSFQLSCQSFFHLFCQSSLQPPFSLELISAPFFAPRGPYSGLPVSGGGLNESS